MSSLFWSSPDGCVGGLGFSPDPESEFYDDVDNSMLFVPDFPFDEMEVE